MISDSQLRSIETILREFPLCLQIAQFLIQNDRAIDTVTGVAEFWVGRDRMAVLSALDRLLMCGAVIPYNMMSGTLYGLTRQPAIRDWLRKSIAELTAPDAAAGSQPSDGSRPESITAEASE